MDQEKSNEPLLEAKNPDKPAKKTSFLDKTGVYGLELGVAMVTMIIVATVLSFGAFALSQFIYGTAGIGVGQLALWSAASTIVWLPVLYVFYLRSRAYMERHPDIVNNNVQRAFVVIYQVLMLLTVIGFAFTAVYSMLNAFVQAEDMAQTLVTVSLPSFISALVFGGAFIAFFRNPVVSRKVFATGLLVVSVLIVVPVIIYSMVSLRATNMDQNRSNDLYRLQSAITDYYRDKGSTLPDSLRDLPSATRVGLEAEIGEYEYSKQSDTEYELCTVFATDTTNRDVSPEYPYPLEDSIDYYTHASGKQCFTIEQPTFRDFFDLNRNSLEDFRNL